LDYQEVKELNLQFLNLGNYFVSILFKEKNSIPNQMTEVVILIAPINTKMGGSPKYTSDKIPKGIKSPPSANQDIVPNWFNRLEK
jgi:hypothetical protein